MFYSFTLIWFKLLDQIAKRKVIYFITSALRLKETTIGTVVPYAALERFVLLRFFPSDQHEIEEVLRMITYILIDRMLMF